MKSSIDLLSLCNNSLVYYVGSIVFGNIEYFQSANTTPGWWMNSLVSAKLWSDAGRR